MTSNDDTTTTTAKLDALGAAELAREHGLTAADSVALRGLSRADAEKVAATFAGDANERKSPMQLVENIRRAY